MSATLHTTPRLVLFNAACAAPAVIAGVWWPGLTWPALAFGAAAWGAGSIRGSASARSSLFVPTVWRGDVAQPFVALTFDDGPDPTRTPQVLDALGEAGARATFFMIGRAAERHPEIVSQVVAAGHQVANHSMNHPRWLNLATSPRMVREMQEGEACLARLSASVTPMPYRPPIGLRSPSLMRALRRFPRTVVTWSIHGRDRRASSPREICDRVVSRAGAGDIVVLHDGSDASGGGPPHTAAAVGPIARGLRERGLACVTLAQMFGR